MDKLYKERVIYKNKMAKAKAKAKATPAAAPAEAPAATPAEAPKPAPAEKSSSSKKVEVFRAPFENRCRSSYS